MSKYRFFFLYVLFLLLMVGCGSPISRLPAPTSSGPETRLSTPEVPETMEEPVEVILEEPEGELQGFQPPEGVPIVKVDVNKSIQPISPKIYGVSGAYFEYLQALRPTFSSWGGNTSTRYNWKLGNAWNAGSDWFYRNGNYGIESGNVADMFVSEAMTMGIDVRLALPTLGWVAKNDDMETCSFPLPEGGCGDAEGSNCANPIHVADPNLANIPIDVDFVADWVNHLLTKKGFDIAYFAMDNEPELWGYTHYDVHPTCTTYSEILDRYLLHARAVREIAPEVMLAGPVTCCWYYYWESAAGNADKQEHSSQEFLPWFLDQVRKHDEEYGKRTLDVLDIHYYPEGLYNDDISEGLAAKRLRSTRSLWDPNYEDESWIGEPVNLIPLMQDVIKRHYPGTLLGISEWNWGADTTMNGALAIADVLGIFGREGVHYAAYWRYPEIDSAGFYAFKLYTNYDDKGSRFGDTSVWSNSSSAEEIGSHAAVDRTTGNLHLMLLNKQPEKETEIFIYLEGYPTDTMAQYYRLSSNKLNEYEISTIPAEAEGFTIKLPAYSITHLIFQPKR
jgi:hypothetical protein